MKNNKMLKRLIQRRSNNKVSMEMLKQLSQEYSILVLASRACKITSVPPMTDLDFQDSYGWTALHHAVHRGYLPNIAFLLGRGASTEIIDNRGQTPLHMAARKHNSKILVILIRGGANKDAQDYVGRTPLHHALETEQDENLTYLVDSGANIDIGNEDGETVLHLASQLEELGPEMLKILLKRGGNLDSKDHAGWTALHYAVRHENSESVQYLLDNGASVYIKCDDGETPYHLNNPPLDSEVKCLVGKHILKLKLAGVPKSVQYVESSLSKEEETKCLKELDQIISTEVGEGHYLNEIFTKFEKPSYLLDEDLSNCFEACVQSIDFLERFPIYGQVLRKTFTRGYLSRYYLSIQASKSLLNKNRNGSCRVTQDVWEYIFSFLTEEDLSNFIKSGTEN